ncbi:chymotrypsin-like protease CTRL-1 [Drosophila gunungcola]|uniref:Peptidase S1 domain-containing protein n=1 Tax=Drosophila gunungcola TaxID=103775 RepID=A0A9P9YG48_9MUSC|nr:chymotrypsin-like protease CTRL-1 [Drosophila gunungcola]KAI8036312.1 hypothetical protein M5D96_010905 [Drosophila gunungcola]
MLSEWIFFFYCLTSLGQGLGAQFLEPNCGIPSSTSRIQGGQNAKIGANPWMAYLKMNSTLACAGTLITKRFVLTAAHCLQFRSIDIVYLGVYDTMALKNSREHVCITPCEEYGVKLILKHKLYGEEPGESYDIGLLKLNRIVEYKVYIRPVCLLLNPAHAAESPTYEATGWGKTDRKNFPTVLQTIILSRLDPAECERYLETPVEWGQICAGRTNGDTCTGDSGGPLVHKMSKGEITRTIQFGIVSYGHYECRGPAVYTDVLALTKWILGVIRWYGN